MLLADQGKIFAQHVACIRPDFPVFPCVLSGLRKDRESRGELQVFADGGLKSIGRVHPHTGTDVDGQQVTQAENALALVEAIVDSLEIDSSKNAGKAVQVVIVGGHDL